MPTDKDRVPYFEAKVQFNVQDSKFKKNGFIENINEPPLYFSNFKSLRVNYTRSLTAVHSDITGIVLFLYAQFECKATCRIQHLLLCIIWQQFWSVSGKHKLFSRNIYILISKYV